MKANHRFEKTSSGTRRASIVATIALSTAGIVAATLAWNRPDAAEEQQACGQESMAEWSRPPSAEGLPEADRSSSMATAVLEQLPLSFVENRGQWNVPSRFVAKRGGINAHLGADAITYQIVRRERSALAVGEEEGRLRGVNLRLVFEGSNPEVRIKGQTELPGRFHYFLGSDPSTWRTEVASYQGVTYEDLYDGVDLVVREEERSLEYDVSFAPWADVDQVAIRVDGTKEPIRLDADGSLVMSTELGEVRQPRPTTWQIEEDGEKVAVDCRYRLLEGNRFAFHVPDFDPSHSLIIDPGLIYSTYLGGSSTDEGSAVAVATDASGVVTVTGKTLSTNFPLSAGAFDAVHGGNAANDAFVARFNAAGSALVFSTYLGGAQIDEALDLAVDSSGATIVTGWTSSTDFPVTAGSYDTTYNGSTDGFVAKLSSSGGSLVYSTFLGGANVDNVNAILIDAAGAATLAGTTNSPTFPGTAGSFRPSFSVLSPSIKGGFVTRLSSSGDSLVWSTFLDRDTEAWGLSLSAAGEVTVTGFTGSSLYPTTAGAYDTTYNGNNDVFVTRLNSSGSSLVYSTFIGGTQFDQGFAVGIDSTGAATVAGYTMSNNFPATAGAFDTTFNGVVGSTKDAIVAKLSPAGDALAYATYLGGSVNEIARGLVVDSTGAATIVGETTSSNYPMTADAFDASFNSVAGGSGNDVMLSRLSSTGATLLYSTFLGGANNDEGRGVTIESTGVATIVGFSVSADYPTTAGAFLTTNTLFNRQVIVTRLQIAVLDTVPPAVTITAPSDGAIVGTTTVTLSADVVDTGATTVVSSPAGINTALLAGGGSVSGSVPLVEGSNVLAVSATDAANNVGGTSITVIRDTIDPGIVVQSPGEGSIFAESPASLTIDVQDATATTVTFGTNSILLPAGGGQALGDVALLEGTNTISITATDAAGNFSTVDLHVLLDLTAPLITIDSPADGACFGPGDSPVAVMATIDDLTETSVDSTPAGVSGTVSAGGGVITGAVALAEGSNTITINATDDANRMSSADVVVLLDTTAPDVAIDSPVLGSNVRGTIDLQASAMDVAPGTGVAQVDVSVDDVLVASLSTPPYHVAFDTTTVVDGLHSFEATAGDGKGNSAVAEVTAFVDNALPLVSISSPANGAYVSGTVAFGVTASDTGSGLQSISMLANGSPPTVDDSVTYPTPVFSDNRSGQINTTFLLDGPLALSATAVDVAGNEATAAASVIVDNTAPTKTISSPTEGATVSGIIPITASADDPNLDTIELLVDSVSVGVSSTSPFTVNFDTRSKLDGPMVVTAIATDLAGNSTSCSVNVSVDNMLMVEISPRVLHLKSHGGGKVKAHLEGANVALLVPPGSHSVQLRVPGGNAVAALSNYHLGDSDNDGIPNLNLEFDRTALIASIRAGIAANMIQPNSQVLLTLVADGTAIATDFVRITGQ